MAKSIKKTANRRLRKMIMVTAMSAVVLAVSTYAWFIGTQTVNVSSFDVEIAATESLMLSLDGAKWDTTVNISKDILDQVSYEGHKNTWGGNGLIPVSSVGDVDNASSRLVLFEKTSITANQGGYRLMASRVKNTATEGQEDKGYVAFDLFVKNTSGTRYINEYDVRNEEAIYLTTDSAVDVAVGGVGNTGIENSVRVAFAQIGRVPATTTNASTITGLGCTATEGAPATEGSSTIGICRTAQIWEPNDVKHVTNAIAYYQKSCKTRTVASGVSTYGSDCGEVLPTNAYPTYAVKKEILDTYNVNVYDGLAYNGYAGTSTGEESYLKAFPYFTDTQKMLTGVERPTFMTLAPSSITKVRVYIYVEGQDVDNYDLASIGKKIAVKFGFTKQRFTEGDINYTGDSTIAPRINVPSTSNPLRLTTAQVNEAGFDILTASGVTATYAKANETGLYVEYTGTENIITTGTVEATAGTYTIRYEITDDRGYKASSEIRAIVTE